MCDYGLISRIQRFSLDDGPGIRTTVFTQGCNLGCPWCHNPETIPIDGAVMLYDALCGRCGACRDVCPVHIIENCRIADRSKCLKCGRCAKACNNSAIVLSGAKMSVDSVFDYISEDIPYYNESGGGITISGGEPLLQPDFCVDLSRKCVNNGINVIIDTAGNVPFSVFERLLPFVDCFYYDVKTDEAGYDRLGGGGERVYSNLERLSGLCDVLVRIPEIPGVNDKADIRRAIMNRLSNMKIADVEYLPFHRLATGKYKALGLAYDYGR